MGGLQRIIHQFHLAARELSMAELPRLICLLLLNRYSARL